MKPAPCIWCDSDTMDWNASPNGKDICNDCEDNAVEAEDLDKCRLGCVCSPEEKEEDE